MTEGAIITQAEVRGQLQERCGSCGRVAGMPHHVGCTSIQQAPDVKCVRCGLSGGLHHMGCKSILPQTEVRITDAKTGGEKGSKLQRFSLIPAEFLWQLAEHYGKGARKYADRNWEKGYAWSLTVDALLRHVNQFIMGDRYDLHNDTCLPDCVDHTGSHHLVCAAWHCIALFIFDLRGLGTNDIQPINKFTPGEIISVDNKKPWFDQSINKLRDNPGI